jgi:cobalt/nickel transport system permease protein
MNPFKCADEMLYLDSSSGKGTFMFKLDGRVKILAAFLGILTTVTLGNWSLTLPFTLGCLSLAILSKVGVKQYLSRMVYPGLFAAFIALVQPFMFGETVLYSIDAGFINLKLYTEGVGYAMLIFSRIIAAVSILNLLTLTTPMAVLLEALAWLRVPKTMVTLTALMLRYIFLFIEEGTKIYRAQCSRGAYADTLGYMAKIRNYSLMGAALIEGSIRRSSGTYRAMLSRGYSEGSRLCQSKKLLPRDVIAGFLVLIFLFTILVADKTAGGTLWTL